MIGLEEVSNANFAVNTIRGQRIEHLGHELVSDRDIVPEATSAIRVYKSSRSIVYLTPLTKPT